MYPANSLCFLAKRGGVLSSRCLIFTMTSRLVVVTHHYGRNVSGALSDRLYRVHQGDGRADAGPAVSELS